MLAGFAAYSASLHCVAYSAHGPGVFRQPCRWSRKPLQPGRWEAAGVKLDVVQGMEPDAGMLRGEALTEDAGGTAFVHSFPAADMPADPAQRFGALFAARPRWQLAELQPYLAGLRVSPSEQGVRLSLSVPGSAQLLLAALPQGCCKLPQQVQLPWLPCTCCAPYWSVRPVLVLQMSPGFFATHMACLQVPGRSTEALLLMYARTSQEDKGAPVFYSAR